MDEVSFWPGMTYEELDRVRAGMGSQLRDLIRGFETPLEDVGRVSLIDPRTFTPMLTLEDVEFDPRGFSRKIIFFTLAPREGSDFEEVAAKGRSVVTQVLAWGWRCKGLEDPTLPFRHPLVLWPGSDIDPCAAGPEPSALTLSCQPPPGWVDSAIWVGLWCRDGGLFWVLDGELRFP